MMLLLALAAGATGLAVPERKSRCADRFHTAVKMPLDVDAQSLMPDEAGRLVTPPLIASKFFELGPDELIPARISMGPVALHHDRNDDWFADIVKLMYLDAAPGEDGAPHDFVLVDVVTNEEHVYPIVPGLAISYTNECFLHRVDAADTATRKVLGPVSRRGRELLEVGSDSPATPPPAPATPGPTPDSQPICTGGSMPPDFIVACSCRRALIEGEAFDGFVCTGPGAFCVDGAGFCACSGEDTCPSGTKDTCDLVDLDLCPCELYCDYQIDGPDCGDEGDEDRRRLRTRAPLFGHTTDPKSFACDCPCDEQGALGRRLADSTSASNKASLWTKKWTDTSKTE